MNTRRLGLIAAIVMLAGGLGTVAYFVLRQPPPPPIDDAELAAVPNVRDLGAGADPTGLATSSTSIQIEDKHDPGRIAVELAWDRLEPIESRHYRVEQPEATIHLRSGGLVKVRSDEARVYWPDRTQPPESGQLSGSVLIRLWDAGDDSPDPAYAMEVPSISFNITLGEVATTDRFTVRFERGSLASEGMRLLYNDAAQRIELLDLDRGGTLTVNPPDPKSGSRVASAPAEPAPISEAPPSTRPPATPPRATRPGTTPSTRPPAGSSAVEILYSLRVNDDVDISRGTLRATGDTLEAWARLIDGALPEGAIPGLDSLALVPPPPPATLGVISPTAMIAASVLASPRAGEIGQPATPSAPAQPLVVHWTGPAQLVPLDRAPVELAGANHVALRLWAEDPLGVTFEERARELSGACARLDYRATMREVEVHGAGGSDVVVDGPEMGEARVAKFSMNMATGVASIGGHGSARSQEQSLAWKRSAEFNFAVGADGELAGLRRAILEGAVEAQTPEGSVTGGTLHAWFDETLPVRTGIQRLEVDSGEGALVVAQTVEGGDDVGSLATRRLIVEFAASPDAERPRPRRLEAIGEVTAARGGSILASDSLEANLGQRTDGSTFVEWARASGNASFTGEGDTRAAADEIIAEPELERATLIGEGAFVSSEGTTITGEQLTLDRAARTVGAFGAGVFEHRPSPTDDVTIRASWAKEMAFDDLAGTLRASGEVVAVSTPDARSTDRVDAETVDLLITAASPSPTAQGDARPRRMLVRGTMLGASHVLGSGPDARVESRRYAEENGVRTLSQVVFLDSARIIAEEAEGTLRAPGPGRLLVLDRRENVSTAKGAPDATPPDATPDAANARGTTLFTWQGSMAMSRPRREATMQRGVRLIHEGLESNRRTELECESLTGRFAEVEGRPAGKLEAVDAAGAVWLRSGARELVADAVRYDALLGRASVRAAEGNDVTLFDAATATPISAGELAWDLNTDTITILRPGTVTSPR